MATEIIETKEQREARWQEEERKQEETALNMSFLQLLDSPMFNYYVDNYDPERSEIGLQQDTLHYVIEDLLNKSPNILVLIVGKLHYYHFDQSCYSMRDVAHRALCNWFWDKKESPFMDIHSRLGAMVTEWKRNRE